MGVGGLCSDLLLGFMEESLQVFLVHEVFGNFLWSDSFVGYDYIGGKLGGVVFPSDVTVDGAKGIG